MKKKLMVFIAVLALGVATLFAQNNQTAATINDVLTKTWATFVATSATIGTGTISSAVVTSLNVAGNGTSVTKITLHGASLNYGSIASLASADLTITVTGAAAGMPVSVANTAPNAGLVYTAYVSAADTVTVRAHNYTAGAIDPAATTVNVLVFGYIDI